MISEGARLALISLALGFTAPSSEPITDAELSSAVAAVITHSGLPCAKVLDVSPLETEDHFRVTCAERQNDDAVVHYIMNMRDGTAKKA